MFKVNSGTKIYLHKLPVNMCRAFDGLSLIATKIKKRPLQSEELFVFMNKRADYIKVLYSEEHAMCIWAKKLERGYQFEADKTGSITHHQFDEFVKSHLLPALKKAA